jgi:hypothetical protein
VTVDEAPTIGSGLALGHGVSKMIATLEPELVALNRTVSSSSALLKTITQLGGRLNRFNPNMAPIVVPLHIRQPDEGRIEQPGASAPKLERTHTAHQATVQDASVSRPPARTHQAKLSSLGDLHPGDHLVSQATPTSPQDTPVPIAASSTVSAATKRLAIRAAGLREPALASPSPAMQASSSFPTSLSSPDSATSVLIRPITPAIQPSTTLSIAPSITPSITRSIGLPVLRSVLPSISPNFPAPSDGSSQVTNPLQIAAADMTKIYGSDLTSQSHGVMMGALAPGSPSELAPHMPAAPISGPVDGVGVMPSTSAPPFLINDDLAGPVASQSVSTSSEPQQASSEPRQGMLVLDGAQLGRWVIDHLESSASRPGAMTTGIDPRMNATYPGAPTGA